MRESRCRSQVSPQSLKRIHKPARPTADHAVRQSRFQVLAFISGPKWRTEYRRDDAASLETLRGTLIHNGKCSPTPAIGSLSVALVQSSFRSFTMAEVCRSTLLAACFSPAMFAAILLAMIATAADPEDGVTFLPTAKPLTQNVFRVGSHSHLKARLDNRQRSCQRMNGYLDGLSTERFCHWTPIAANGRGLFLLNLPQEATRLMGMMSLAPSAR